MTLRTAVLVSALLAAAVPASADDPTERARAAFAEYGRNVRSITAFKCKYTVTHGTAATLDEIEAGRYAVASVHDHVAMADGPRRLWSRTPRKPPRANAAGDPEGAAAGGAVARPAADDGSHPVTRLSNGTEDLTYWPGSPGYGAATVSGHDGKEWGAFSPLTLDLPDVFATGPGGWRLAADDLPATDRRPAVGVRLVSRSGDFLRTLRLALDPARGHLPCRATLVYGDGPPDSGVEFRLLAARDCGRGRFFPTRFVRYFRFPPDQGYSVTELAVTELDVDSPPTRDELSVPLPAGTQMVLKRGDRAVGVPLRRGAVIHLDDLPAMAADLEAEFPPPPARDRLRALAARWGPWAAAALAGAAAVLLVQLRLTRRRRAGPAEGAA